ncbi:hypothetical protein EON66_07065 [archaeon]|nr:MAG: hypothetical protein EON66_07065 [archaeon]
MIAICFSSPITIPCCLAPASVNLLCMLIGMLTVGNAFMLMRDRVILLAAADAEWCAYAQWDSASMVPQLPTRCAR